MDKRTEDNSEDVVEDRIKSVLWVAVDYTCIYLHKCRGLD